MDLTDEQWKVVETILPEDPVRDDGRGRPWSDRRKVLNGVLWILRTGAPWRDLPERYGAWRTVASRFYRWQKAGIWQKILAELQRQADGTEQVDWSKHYVDSTLIRAHQHAAGAKGGVHKLRR